MRYRPHITIGRSETNELIIANPLASRQHAQILYTRGRFILRDQSVNGTVDDRPDAQPLSLLRDEFALRGRGRIGLGETPDENDKFTIRYQCR